MLHFMRPPRSLPADLCNRRFYSGGIAPLCRDATQLKQGREVAWLHGENLLHESLKLGFAVACPLALGFLRELIKSPQILRIQFDGLAQVGKRLGRIAALN